MPKDRQEKKRKPPDVDMDQEESKRKQARKARKERCLANCANLELGISEDEEVISRMRKRVLNAKTALWGERDTLQQIEEEENPRKKDERRAAATAVAPQARKEEPRIRRPRRVGDGAKRRSVESRRKTPCRSSPRKPNRYPSWGTRSRSLH
ncbi:MAG: uncharacterized protein A8A55_1982 [Amphiamblys sp. WSBS2006]|nr:MAG: uncharacterized protein A8A55_1982 [Amphiamblys sp. WSBS2006]